MSQSMTASTSSSSQPLSSIPSNNNQNNRNENGNKTRARGSVGTNTTSSSDNINGNKNNNYMNKKNDTHHAWETSTTKDANWSSLSEDAHGNLINHDPNGDQNSTPAERVRARRRRLRLLDHSRSSRRIVRDMIRYLYIMIDASARMMEKEEELFLPPAGMMGTGSHASAATHDATTNGNDNGGIGNASQIGGGKMTRLEIVLELARRFVMEYYDQNPLSHLGIVLCRNGEAEILAPLSGSKRVALTALAAVAEGSKNRLLDAISDAAAADSSSSSKERNGGVWSFQNGLEVSGRSLGHMPRYGSREVVVLVGSLSTCDPADVLVETLPKLVHAKVRVSCVALSAEMSVCRKICERTGGVMGVALDGRHCADLIMGLTTPPPKINNDDLYQDNGSNDNNNHENHHHEQDQQYCEFVQMGFPTRETEDIPTLIHAGAGSSLGSGNHNNATKDTSMPRLLFARTGYICPRCHAKVSELPSDCAVCNLKLVLAPHLARSFHHLFPIPPFAEIPEHLQISNVTNDNTNTDVHKDHNISKDQNLTLSLPTVTSSSSTIQQVLSCNWSNIGFQANKDYVSNTHRSSSNNIYNDKNKHNYKHMDMMKVNIDSALLISSSDCDRCCFACLKIIGVHDLGDTEDASHGKNDNHKQKKIKLNHKICSNHSKHKLLKKNDTSNTKIQQHRQNEPDILRFQCPECQNIFCADCDAYLHETLHNCPGCLSK
mmetsp:Transcript_17730/g.25019  ORF Transcript_17730/g.25019 Transcript_17730/m.25019 type:complete len:718 (+) Transcript_17730:18-2171(+)